MEMFNKGNFLKAYLQEAPVPLAMERTLECKILSKQQFIGPVLDVGCGEGLFANVLFSEKIDVGIDPNAKELIRAKEYGSYKELINCWGDKIPKQDNFFNTIFSNSVMEHIPNIEPVLSEMHRLLNQNGNIYLTLPTDLFEKYTIVSIILNLLCLQKLAKSFGSFFNRFWRHYHCYDKQGWIVLFEKHKFKVVNVLEYASKKTCVLNDAMAPFSLLSFVNKKIINRWFISHKMARVFSALKYQLFKNFISDDEINIHSGGLIFFHLQKND